MFRAHIAEYVSLLPPNSHGEANPADKDPVPPPFDNTYNSPEHDAFVMNVKYQRNDRFFTDNIVDGADRARLNQAWNDLFGSWPYHDAYLGMLADHYKLKLESRRIQDMNAARIAALPAAIRPHVISLRAHYDEVMKAQALAQPGHVADALAFASRAWRRPLTVAEKASLRAFYQRSRTANHLDHDARHPGAASPASWCLRPSSIAWRRMAPGPERPLNGWELASRMSFFLWSSIPDDELRRAAAAGELSESRDAGETGEAHDGRSEGAPLRDRVLRAVAGVLSLRPVPRRGHGTLSRVHRRREVGDVRRGHLDLRAHRPARPSGQGDPRRRLHVPEQAAGEVLRDRAKRDVIRQGGAGGRRERAQPRRRAAARFRVDDDVGAAAHESRQARRLDLEADSRNPDAAAAGRRGQHRGRRSHVPGPDAAREAGRAQAQRHVRQLPPEDRPAGLSARRLRRGRPVRATRMPTASPSTSPANSRTRPPSSAPRVSCDTCRSTTSR